MVTKQMIKLSKQLLLDLSSLKYTQDDSVNLQPEYRDYKKCSTNCPFYKNRDVSLFCQKECVFVLSTSSIVKPRENVLTYTQIKQLLFYNSTVFENNGVTIALSHKDVAKAINCSERTARDNINALIKAGYIVISSYNNSTYKVFIKDYHKYHQKGNRGHLYLSNKCFKALIKIDNINTLRLALLGLVRLDDMRVSKDKNPSKELSYKVLINLLPSNITCPKQIVKIFAKAKELFKIIFKEDSISISFNKDIDSVAYAKNLNKNNKKALSKFLKRFGLDITNKDKDDLLQMSIQYNIHIVTNAFKYIKDKNPEELGSYLRTVIRNNFNSLISC
jgi:hypothetical protein|nr:MAG TPA: replication protein O [Caudoviricetes sp.]